MRVPPPPVPPAHTAEAEPLAQPGEEGLAEVRHRVPPVGLCQCAQCHDERRPALGQGGRPRVQPQVRDQRGFRPVEGPREAHHHTRYTPMERRVQAALRIRGHRDLVIDMA